MDNCIKRIQISFQKVISKNDFKVANLRATKMYDHSHTIWDETKAKTGCTLLTVVFLNELVVDETCDCESCKNKKKTKKNKIKVLCKKSNKIPIFHFFPYFFLCNKFSKIQNFLYFFLYSPSFPFSNYSHFIFLSTLILIPPC